MNNPRLSLRQLRIFAAIAETGSTTAAAATIGLSQSATSAALKELERLLGAVLFDRSGKRLHLNDQGRALLPGALALVDGANGLERSGGGRGRQIRSLRIGASTTIGNYRLPGLLARFYAGAPDVMETAWQAGARIGNTAAIVDAVADFELDVGLIEGPAHHPAVRAGDWLQDELVIVGAPHKKAARSLAELSAQVWLLREVGSGTREMTDQLLLPHLGAWQRRIELGSSEAIKQAVVEGMGFACLSRWVVADLLASGGLVALQTPLPRLTRQCYWIIHRDKQPTPALSAFIAIATAAHAAL